MPRCLVIAGTGGAAAGHGSGITTSAAYGISVQGWGSWFGDQGKALGLTLVIGVPVLLLFNWIVRRWPRRYWLGIWVVTLPILVVVIFVAPLLVPLFDKFEPLEKNHPALVAKLEKVVARTGIEYSAGPHVSDEGQREDQRAERVS